MAQFGVETEIAFKCCNACNLAEMSAQKAIVSTRYALLSADCCIVAKLTMLTEVALGSSTLKFISSRLSNTAIIGIDVASRIAAQCCTRQSTWPNAMILALLNVMCCGSCHQQQSCFAAAGATSSKLSNAAIIAIAVVGGVVALVLLTVIFCCCRGRYKAKEAAAVGAVPDKGPAPKPATPNAPQPFSVNYPQFQASV